MSHPIDPTTDRVAALGGLLRATGAAVVAASAATFLLQRWSGSDDLTRYLALLGQAVVLAGAGFFCGLRLAERRSARTFLALAAGMLPALFAVLGGLVYSQFSLDGGLTPVAGYATWRASSPGAALGAVLATTLAAAPIAGLALLALARPLAARLTPVFLLANAALLVPTRASDATAGLVAVLVAGLAWTEWRHVRACSAMRTREGLIVRGLLALPVGLIVARNLIHYAPSLYLLAIASFGVSALILAASQRGAPADAAQEDARGDVPTRSDDGDTRADAPTRSDAASAAFEGIAMAPAALGFLAFAVATVDALGLGDAALLPLAAWPFAALLVVRSLRAPARVADGQRTAAVAVTLVAMGVNAACVPGVPTAFGALASGIAAIAWGHYAGRRGLLAAGGVVAAAALVSHVGHAARVYDALHWSSLTLLGAGVIFGASLLERHHARLAGWLERTRRDRSREC